jgi:hypothetical protein
MFPASAPGKADVPGITAGFDAERTGSNGKCALDSA